MSGKKSQDLKPIIVSKIQPKSSSKLAWSSEKPLPTTFQTSNARQKKEHTHTKFLFFGHERVRPANGNNGFNSTERHDRFANKQQPSGPEPKLSCCGKILQMWADDDSVLRLSWSTGLLIIFSFCGGGVFYAIERNVEGCEWDYWQSLWFFNTIFTTIGYGSLAPCSASGKVVAVFAALIGILLNVVALGDVGKLLTRLLTFFWIQIYRFYRFCKRCCCSKNSKNATKLIDETASGSQASTDLPLSFALLVTLIWFCISAMFFHFSEPDNIYLGDAFYYIMISVTTVGFGDVTPKKYHLAVVHFFFIIIGIALFSMVYNIIQDKLNSLSDSVEDLISKEYTKAQQDGTILPGNDEKTAREYVRSIMKKQKGGGLLQLVMSKNTEDRLVHDYMEKSKKRLVATQTDNITHDQAITAFPNMADFGHMFTPAYGSEMQDKGTQLRWMPSTLNHSADWLNLMHSQRPTKNISMPRSISQRSNSQRKK